MTYRVFASSPKTEKTSEIAFITEGKPTYFHRITAWKELGIADSYEQARERFGGRPVLEWITNATARTTPKGIAP